MLQWLVCCSKNVLLATWYQRSFGSVEFLMFTVCLQARNECVLRILQGLLHIIFASFFVSILKNFFSEFLFLRYLCHVGTCEYVCCRRLLFMLKGNAKAIIRWDVKTLDVRFGWHVYWELITKLNCYNLIHVILNIIFRYTDLTCQSPNLPESKLLRIACEWTR